MPVYVDSTALIALGELSALSLLQHLQTHLVITPTIQLEVRRSASQVAEAISAGWMVVEAPDTATLVSLMQATRLDEGEASLIAVAQRVSASNVEFLIDERYAFSVLRQQGVTNVICLAQALHRLEDAGYLPSCKVIMDQLADGGYYGWAKPVRQFYEQWCSTVGKASVL